METLIERMAKKKETSPAASIVLPLLKKEHEHEGACGEGCGCGGAEGDACCG